MMSKPKRLHPTAMIFKILEMIKDSIIGLLPLAVLILRDGFFGYIFYIVIGIVALMITSSIIYWLRFTYEVTDDEIRIEQGLFIRKKRYISKNRIQSIDLTQSVIHRIFGLTKVQIETAGSDRDVDASLSSVQMVEGERIHDELKSTNGVENDEEELDNFDFHPDPKREVTTKRLVIAGSTSGSLGVLLGLFGFLFSQMESILPESFYDEMFAFFLSLAINVIVILVIVVVLVLYLLGILGTVIKYGKFTITRYENELFITRGLLEKKQMTIPLKRIQAVGITESIIRQPFGFCTVYVEIAGGEVQEGSGTKTLLFPILKKTEVRSFLEEILPEYAHIPENMNPAPKRALPYYLVRALFIPVIALIATFIFIPEWYIIPVIVFILGAILGYLNYRAVGYHLDEELNELTLSYRRIGKETVLLKHRRIQSITKSKHIIQRKQNLASIHVSLLNNFGGRHIFINELNLKDIHKITDWYSLR